jgi:hypothetical protein
MLQCVYGLLSAASGASLLVFVQGCIQQATAACLLVLL